MAMLAGPRRKQKVINLRAKNNDWSNDNTKFGQRMLEKMGWTDGKGLGAKENGVVEHVVARYKNDDRGLGFEDKNDQWTKHEDDFNALLANLSNSETNDEKLHSGVSLEVKSKKSKARVHYHKFTRGKDISRYSEKDLANIFGKKTFKNGLGETDDGEDPENINKNNSSEPAKRVFTEKGSMEDYFKNKLAMLKSKNHFPNFNMEITRNCDEEADFAFKGFSGTFDDNTENNSSLAFESFSIEKSGIVDNSNCDNKSKSKKNKSKINDSITIEQTEGTDEINSPEKPSKRKKKKNKYNHSNETNECLENDSSKVIVPSEVINKKESKKDLGREVSQQLVTEPKKKKSKRKAETIEETPVEVNIEVYKPKKKKKKNKDV